MDNFQNFKSFRDEVSLNLTATKITEFSNHVASISKKKELKLSALYGANASGKSNVYEAFDFMTYYVINSYKFGGENEKITKENNDYLKVSPFLFDKESISKNRVLKSFSMIILI